MCMSTLLTRCVQRRVVPTCARPRRNGGRKYKLLYESGCGNYRLIVTNNTEKYLLQSKFGITDDLTALDLGDVHDCDSVDTKTKSNMCL